jgi:uncharacterized protein YndB with AHSA1/START domain
MGTLPKTCSVAVHVDAAPATVYALVADVTRTGEWSHEAVQVDWVDGATEAVPGARFRGRNQQGWSRWTRQCEVLTTDRPHTFSFRTVPGVFARDSSVWSFTIEPEGSGTRLTQRYEVVRVHPLMDRLLYLVMPAHRDRRAALQQDLERLARLAERDRDRGLTITP